MKNKKIIISIGGEGNKTLMNFLKFQNDEQLIFPYPEMIALDIEKSSVDFLRENNIPAILLSENFNAEHTLKDKLINARGHKGFLDWWGKDTKLLNPIYSRVSFNGFRKLGRLLFEKLLKENFLSTLQNFIFDKSEFSDCDIFILSSSYGGVGSSFAILLPYFLRAALTDFTRSFNLSVNGIFLPYNGENDFLLKNQSAFLKELHNMQNFRKLNDKKITTTADFEFTFNGKDESDWLVKYDNYNKIFWLNPETSIPEVLSGMIVCDDFFRFENPVNHHNSDTLESFQNIKRIDLRQLIINIGFLKDKNFSSRHLNIQNKNLIISLHEYAEALLINLLNETNETSDLIIPQSLYISGRKAGNIHFSPYLSTDILEYQKTEILFDNLIESKPCQEHHISSMTDWEKIYRLSNANKPDDE